ncbi:MAG: Cyclin- protein fam58a [Sclerophora amabilis]|nr:MAG: Cyclin- protein fam58a [Sclerophora amabilis]
MPLFNMPAPASPRDILLAAEAQWIFSEEELSRTPSGLDGMPLDQERENRGKGVNFITQVGIMLKLPQLTLATASVILHRFFMRHSMVDKGGRPGFHYYAVAATSLFLATKVEENCRKMRELVIACCRVAQKNSNLVIDEQSKEYWRWRDTILHNEDILLEAICFDVSLEPPYKTLFSFLDDFGEQNNKKLRNAGWAFLNDSNLTMLCLLFPSRTIAAASLYCAAKQCDVAFPDRKGRAWWEILGVELQEIRRACNYMASVYENSPLKHSENIYSRTPEDGDPLFARTRARGSEPVDSPTPENGQERSDMARAASTDGRPERSGKRPREDGDNADTKPVVTNGDTPSAVSQQHARNGDIDREPKTREEQERKRIKTGDQQVNEGADVVAARPAENGFSAAAAAAAKEKEEDLSEEGEVES